MAVASPASLGDVPGPDIDRPEGGAMGWKAEFGESWDVPRFIDFIAGKGLVKDLSWKNDMSPLFGLFDEKTNYLVGLWVGHPFLRMREDGGKRFIVTAGESGTTPDRSADFDEMEEALLGLFRELVAAKLAGDPEMADDPEYFLQELLEKHSGR
jgi:hypothetical protein